VKAKIHPADVRRRVNFAPDKTVVELKRGNATVILLQVVRFETDDQIFILRYPVIACNNKREIGF